MFKVRRDGTATVVEQKEAKDYTFLTNIFDLCIECVEQGEVPKPQVRYSDIFTVHVTLQLLRQILDWFFYTSFMCAVNLDVYLLVST